MSKYVSNARCQATQYANSQFPVCFSQSSCLVPRTSKRHSLPLPRLPSTRTTTASIPPHVREADLLCDATRAEDVAVGKVLGGEVADGKARQDHVGTRCDDLVEFAENDGPLCIDDALVLL